MGIFSKAEQTIDGKTMQEVHSLLLNGESVEKAYSLMFEYAVVTNHRVLWIDKVGTAGETVVHSMPFSKINSIALGKGALLKPTKNVYLFGSGHSYKLSFFSGENAREFYMAVCAELF
jgi:hypothetical protein